jgi:hypothetical protein
MDTNIQLMLLIALARHLKVKPKEFMQCLEDMKGNTAYLNELSIGMLDVLKDKIKSNVKK